MILLYTDPKRLLAFLDNHDMDRAFTQYKENPTLLKMALATLLILPRVPQLYYGTEILMETPLNHMITGLYEQISLGAGQEIKSMLLRIMA